MAEAADLPADGEPPEAVAPPRQSWFRRLLRWTLRLAVGLALFALVLDSPIGHRLVADLIGMQTTTSGLKLRIGRIGGSLFGKATLRRVTLSDPEGTFAQIPEATLDWRPLGWFWSGLDIRELELRRGTLERVPNLRRGDPDAPILPGFDIRIDRLAVVDLKVAKGVLGEARRVGLEASALVRKGKAKVTLDGKLGGADRLHLLLDAEPDRDRFDFALDYAAPKGGLLAGLTKSRRAMELLASGKGSWTQWDGHFVAHADARRLVALKLNNRAGRMALLGKAWPEDLLSGLAQRAAGGEVSLGASGRLNDGVLDARFAVVGQRLALSGAGKTNLTDNRFDGLTLDARLRDPALLGGDVRIEGAHGQARLDGPFRDFDALHRLDAELVSLGEVSVEGPTTAGTAHYDGRQWSMPLALETARVVTGHETLDPRLVGAKLKGTLQIGAGRLDSDDLAFDVPGLAARLHLSGDLARSGYGLAGNAAARGWAVQDLGAVDADAKLTLSVGRDTPWRLSADLAGRMARVDNGTLTALAGDNIRFSGALSAGSGIPLAVGRAKLDASKLTLALTAQRLADGRNGLAGSGRHSAYGPFTLEAALAEDGPHAAMVLADPWPPGGLKDVRLALAPMPDGFRIETAGESALGPFDGVLGLTAGNGRDTRLDIQKMAIWKTGISGSLLLGNGGASGTLAFAGGGLDGTVNLAPRDGGQGIDVALKARDAHFAGVRQITIGEASLDARGLVAHDRSTVSGHLFGQGIGLGRAFIGRLAANADLTDGKGRVTASVAGRRGSRFALQLQGDIGPGRIALLGRGDFAGKPIVMPRRAVLTRENDGWRLTETQVTFGGGHAIASGLMGGEEIEADLAMADLPLSLADIVFNDAGLGGTVSGKIAVRKPRGEKPTGSAALQVRGLTRSGLVLTSRPVDFSLTAALSASSLDARAVMRDGGAASGRIEARISGLPDEGRLGDRLRAGRLAGKLRYAGPADAIWRLVALEEFDLSGPVTITANASGMVADPRLSGNLSSDALRLRSALTGTDISGISARGHFAGSKLEIATFAGKAGNNGTVTGSGSFDLSGLGTRAPAIDLRIAADHAPVLAKSDMAATVTGPVRIVSDGVNGTIAARLRLDSARWQLGRAALYDELPDIATREVNRRSDVAPVTRIRTAWRYMIDAAGNDRIAVRGLGLDSEWSAAIRLRGTTHEPTIEGRADLVRGGYEFAGKRFDLTRGRISFHGENPPDPRLDIVAEAQESGVTARVAVTGTSLRPEIRFSSVPALPEEELLSRLLFGASVTEISAPEALQLGAALASLRGGGGLDPVNKLRKAIGLDRLRIIGADAALGRGTGVAAGKYLGRRFYAEVVTDGRGYSASELEFRMTSWLSLLATMTTIGRESINVKASKDY